MPSKGQIVTNDETELKLALIELRHACFHVLGEFDGVESKSLDSLREQIYQSDVIVQNYNARQRRRRKGASQP